MRNVALTFVLAATLLDSRSGGAAIAEPTHMLGPANPINFCNGTLPGNASCLPGNITYNSNAMTAALDFGGATCNGDTSHTVNTFKSVSTSPVDGFGRGPEEITVTQYDTSDPLHPRPIAVHFKQRTGTSSGDMLLLDTNGNHIYHQMRLTGNTSSGPVDVTLDIAMLDIDGDGFPDFATLTDLSPLQFPGLNCSNVPGTPGTVNFSTVFVPVAHQPSGDPAIILDLDGNGTPDSDASFGPNLPLAVVSSIPTVSRLGLAILAVLLLLAGLELARRSSRQIAA